MSCIAYHPFINPISLTSAPLDFPSEYRVFISVLIGAGIVYKKYGIEERLRRSILLPEHTLYHHPSRINEHHLPCPNSSTSFLDSYIAPIERTLNDNTSTRWFTQKRWIDLSRLFLFILSIPSRVSNEDIVMVWKLKQLRKGNLIHTTQPAVRPPSSASGEP